ncbi:MAG: DUF2924 domain-containing protein, partial [Brevundimonas sp.]|nr:DUF2924 domain-containing protein [Brevundimonas sp.]
MKSASIEDQLAALTELSSARLGECWAKLTGRPVPRVSRALLRLALAWEIQAKALGGLSRKREWQGFEPTVRLPVRGISTATHSTSVPP